MNKRVRFAYLDGSTELRDVPDNHEKEFNMPGTLDESTMKTPIRRFVYVGKQYGVEVYQEASPTI